MRLGFIGLGVMGESMSASLIQKSGQDVFVYDINTRQVEAAVHLGGKGCVDIASVANSSDIIFIMVPTKDHVAGVIKDMLPVLREGQVVVDMSTIEPSASIAFAEMVASKGAIMLDAPVVKSKAAAISGNLGIYVGGDQETFTQVKPYLKMMGSDIIYLGKNGQGLMMKISHNMLVAGIQHAVNEMYLLALKGGLDYDEIAEAISYGGGQNFYMDAKKEAIKNKDFDPKFSVRNMHKDIHIANVLADNLGLNLKGAKICETVYDKAMEDHKGDLDFSAVFETMIGV